MNHEVSGCKDCPMCHEDAAEYFCHHPEREKLDESSYIEYREHNYVLQTPDWCPLNKEPLTIIKQ